MKTILRGYFVAAAMAAMVSCQEPTEGCLDVRATNFDVTARKSCTNCCTFPSLVLQVKYQVGGKNYSADSVYVNSLGQSFKLLVASTYLSNVRLVDSKNAVFTTLDSVTLNRFTDTVNVRNNFALLNKASGSFDFTLGTFNQFGTFSKLTMSVGLNTAANRTAPSRMASSSPLAATTMWIDSTNGYIFNRLVIAKGTNFKDTLRLNIATLKDVEIVKSKSFTEGYNVNIPLIINYLSFFDGVNFSDAENTIKQKIVENYGKAFTIE